MSFLANKLKLEVKSNNSSQLARFASTQKDANIHIIPKDSCNFYGIIGASSHSNIQTYISLNSDKFTNKIVSFDDQTINFGTDTLMKGNLVVLGNITSLGYDVLTDENKFILNNYGTSAEKGLNSASQKTLSYLNTTVSNTSNQITNFIKDQYINLSISLGISNLTSIQNNTFTEDNFHDLFNDKTLDELKQGTSNKFIENNSYNSTNALTITGLLASSNFITNDITANSNIYAKYLRGDGSSLSNLSTSLLNTSHLRETPLSSNLYLTYERIGRLALSSNQHLSNYILLSYKNNSNLLVNQSINITNYLNQTVGNITNTNTQETSSLLSYLQQNRDHIHTNLLGTYADLTNKFTQSSNNLNQIKYNNEQSISNYIHVTSNNLASFLKGKSESTNTNITDLSSLLYAKIDNIFVQYSNLYDISSNTLYNDINTKKRDTSNYISFIENSLLISVSSSNTLSSNNLTNIINTINSILNIHDTNNSNLIQNTKSSLMNNISYAFSNLYAIDIIDYSNIFVNSQQQIQVDTSNYNIYVYDTNTQAIQSTYYSINNEIQDTSNLSYTFLIISDASIQHTAFNISNMISNTSNTLLINVKNNLQTQASYLNNDITTLQTNLNNIIDTITTDSIPETQLNQYYTTSRFYASLDTKTLDDIHSYSQTSNRIIVNNSYPDLTLAGDLTTYNIVTYGNTTTQNSSAYDTEKVEIVNYSNIPAILIENYNTQPNDVIKLSNDTNTIFNLNNTGKLGIKNTNPSETLDIQGTLRATYLKGLGNLLTQVNLTDRSTTNLQEGSNLYFTSSRVASILDYSNLFTSNYITATSNQIYISISSLDNNISNLIYSKSAQLNDILYTTHSNHSNHISSTSNNIYNTIIVQQINQSNLIITTSNLFIISANALYIDSNSPSYQSNYVYTTSNNISKSLYDQNLSISNYVSYQSNVLAALQTVQISDNSNYTSMFSNAIKSYINNIITNHSNLLTNFIDSTDSHIIYANASNYISIASNNLLNYIKQSDLNHSNQVHNIDTTILNYTTNNINNLLTYYNAGDIYTYNHKYDRHVLHLNFNNKKILNSINSDAFRLSYNNSNIVNIYSAINNFTTTNSITNYVANKTAFTSTSNVYLYTNDQYNVKKLMTSINNKESTIHFLFNAQNVQNTPIYYLGNTMKGYMNIRIINGVLFIMIDGIPDLYATTPISQNTWYIIDILMNPSQTSGTITIELFINLVRQQLKVLHNPQDVSYIQTKTYSSNLSYVNGSNVTLFIGLSDSHKNIFYDNRSYTKGISYTNTYFSSNSYINSDLPIFLQRLPTSYSDFNNLMNTSYISSNYDYQYSSNIMNITSNFHDNADNTLIIGDRNFTNLDVLLTEINTNVKLSTGFYHFTLDAQNELAADLQITTYDSNFINVANVYNNSNMTFGAPIYIPEGYYKLNMRLLRNITNRNKNYLIAMYSYSPMWDSSFYNLSDVANNYILSSTIQPYQTQSISTYFINNDLLNSTSNLYVYEYLDVDVLASGFNQYGQLGRNTTTNINFFQQVLGQNATNFIKSITQISAGGNHTLFLQNNGYVYACGYNNKGQLGLGNNTNYNTLQRVKGINGNDFVKNIITVCASYAHSLFLTESASVYVTGYNADGQLAIGNNIDYNTLQVASISDVKHISAKGNHSLFLLHNGTVYACGYNQYGQLGLANNMNYNTPQQVKGSSGIGYVSDVIQVSASGATSLFLRSDKTVLCCGYNVNGGLGIGTNLDVNTLQQVKGVNGVGYIQDVVQVSAQYMFSLLLKADGTVYGTGKNDYGQLGLGNNTNYSTLQQVKGVDGNGFLSNIVAISGNNSFSLFLASNGSLFGCGQNSYGQLGLNNTIDYNVVKQILSNARITHISAGNQHSIIMKSTPASTNVTNHKYLINSNFFAGIPMNPQEHNIKLQDFRIYSDGNLDNISNITNIGLDFLDLEYTSNVIVKPIRWQESSNYYVTEPFNRFITYNHAVGIGKSSVPEATLDIYTDNPSIHSIKTNNTIWVQSSVVTSSDQRIKTNIRDIQDDSALSQILAIQPKTYNYIDLKKGNETVYGFMAQQIRNIIPNAVSLSREVIPNIYKYATIMNDTVHTTYDINLQLNQIIRIDDINKTYHEIVTEIIDFKTFKIENKNSLNGEVFLYGTYVDDFHTLDKNYIYTLSVCATQLLHKDIQQITNDIESMNTLYKPTYEISNISSNIQYVEGALNSYNKKYTNLSTSNDLVASNLKLIEKEMQNYSLQDILISSNNIISIKKTIEYLTTNNSNTMNNDNKIINNNNILLANATSIDTNIKYINDVLKKNNLV